MDGKRTKIRVFQERTNTSADQQHLSTMVISLPGEIVSLSTPFVLQGVKSQPPLSRSQDVASRRSARYSKAEHGLVETLHRSQNEPSPHQLQIVALQNATSMLNTAIVDSGEVLERLRELLSNREMEPDHYRSVQRQRWMEERRLVVAEQLSKALQPHLSPSPLSTKPQTYPSNPKVSVNLVRFLESPRHRVSLRNKNRRRPPRKEKVLESPEVPQTRHHGQPIPLLLSSTRRRLFETPEKRLAVSPPRPTPLPQMPSSIQPPPPLTTASTVNSSVTLVTPISEVVPSPPLSPRSTNGTATIWRSLLRPKDEILSDADLDVTIPDYVNDLLAGLDTNNTSMAPLQPRSPPARSVPSTSPSSWLKFKEPDPPEKAAVGTPPRRRLRKSPSYKRISTILSFPDGLASPKRLSSPSQSLRPIFDIETEADRRLPALRPVEPFAVSLSLSALNNSSGELVSLSEAQGQEFTVPVVAVKDKDGKLMGRFRRRISAFKLSAH